MLVEGSWNTAQAAALSDLARPWPSLICQGAKAETMPAKLQAPESQDGQEQQRQEPSKTRRTMIALLLR